MGVPPFFKNSKGIKYMKIKIKTNKLSKEELQAYLHHKKSAHKHKSKKDYKRNNKVQLYS